MSKLVHLGTEFRSLFGIEDGEGNVVPQDPPISGHVEKFSAESFAQVFETLKQQRTERYAAELGNRQQLRAETIKAQRAARRGASSSGPAKPAPKRSSSRKT